MGNEGAVLFCDRPASAVAAAFETVVVGLGYARSSAEDDLEVAVCASDRGTCVRVEVPKSFALAIARRLGRALKRNVRVFTASVVVTEDDFDCVVDDLHVAVDGATREGAWAAEITSEFGDNWGELCDGKSYFAVSAALDHAIASVLDEDGERRTFRLAPPPSLGAKRLDEIAKNARLGDKVQVMTIGGRECVRISNAGTTLTSFVAPPEAELLRKALSALLT